MSSSIWKFEHIFHISATTKTLIFNRLEIPNWNETNEKIVSLFQSLVIFLCETFLKIKNLNRTLCYFIQKRHTQYVLIPSH